MPRAEHPKSGKMKRGSRNGMERSTGRVLLLKVKIDFRFLRFAGGGLRQKKKKHAVKKARVGWQSGFQASNCVNSGARNHL